VKPNILPLEDGIWQVDVGNVCAAFEVKNGRVIFCSPILRKKFNYWLKFAKLVSCPTSVGATNRTAPALMVPTKTMEQETQPQSTTIDISFDVNEADVARPVLQGGQYDFTIGFAREEPSRKKGLPQLLVGYQLAQMAKDTQGRDVNPGFTITQRLLIQPTGGLTLKMITDRLKQIQFATNGESKFNGDTSIWLGKKVRCSVALREPHADKETGSEYGESNEITRVMPAK
jgi:hypothetical protein